MRVVCGTAKGRKLASFKGERIRPTADRVKEALFNIITANFGPIDGRVVLDLFSGTGNLGIEALSRGAAKAVFVDENPKSVSILKKNLEICSFTDISEMVSASAESGIKFLSKRGRRFDLIFMGPPYEKGYVEKTLKALADEGVLNDDALVVAEHSLRERPTEEYKGLGLTDRRKYGDTEISFYSFTGETPNRDVFTV